MASAIQLSAEVVGIEQSINRIQSRLKPIQIKLDDRFSNGLGDITGKTTDFNRALQAATARVTAFGAAAGAFLLVKRGMTDLIRSTIDVEQALARVNLNLNQSNEGLQQFSKTIFNIARDTGQTFSNAAKAAEELTRQGLGATETAKRLRDALILSRLAGIDYKEAITALTVSINAFSKEALDSSEIVNKIAAVSSKFAISADDLAKGIERVGNSASEAGVPFDQLLGIITSVQQQTARGGAVIGNALKTIFTRTGRPEVLNDLEQLGVGVRDITGHTLPALEILKNLANQYDNVSQAQKSLIAEQVGGVFQINILKAELKDLESAYSVTGRAARASASATNEAFQKNEALNTTLASSINNLSQSLTQLFASFGKINLTPLLKGLVDGLDGITKFLAGSDAGKEAGKALGENIMQGIANVIMGPGLILIGKVLANVFLAVSSKVAMEAGQALSAPLLAPSMPGTGRIGQIRRAAGGILPSIAGEMRDVGRGVGGASSSARPVIIPNFNFGQGKRGPVVANSDEYLVPHYGNGSAIFNRDMVAKLGLPKGAVHLAGGYPNITPAMLAKMGSPKEIIQHLKGLGVPLDNVGAGRAYVQVSDTMGLKIAMNPLGRAANKVEFPILANPGKHADLIPKIYDYDAKDGKYAFLEHLVEPTEKQYMALTGKKAYKLFSDPTGTSGGGPYEQKMFDFLNKHGLEHDFGAGTNLGIGTHNGMKTLKAMDIALNPRLRELAKYDNAYTPFGAGGMVPNYAGGTGSAYATLLLKKLQSASSEAEKEAITGKIYEIANKLPENQKQEILKGKNAILYEKGRIIADGRDSSRTDWSARKNPVNLFKEGLLEANSSGLSSSLSEANNLAKKAIEKQRLQANINHVISQSNAGTISKEADFRLAERSIEKQILGTEPFSKFSRQEIESAPHLNQLFDLHKKDLFGPIEDRRTALEDAFKKQEADKRIGKIQQGLFAGQFAAPFAAGLIQEGKGGTTEGQVRGFGKGVLEGAGTAAALAQFAPEFAPIIVGAGAAIGGLVGIMNKLKKSTEELSQELSITTNLQEKNATNARGYAQTNAELNNAIKSGASQGTIELLARKRDDFLRGLKPETQKKFLDASTEEQRQKVVDEESLESEKLNREKNQKIALSILSQKSRGMFDFSGVEFKKDREFATNLGTELGQGRAYENGIKSISDEKIKKLSLLEGFEGRSTPEEGEDNSETIKNVSFVQKIVDDIGLNIPVTAKNLSYVVDLTRQMIEVEKNGLKIQEKQNELYAQTIPYFSKLKTIFATQEIGNKTSEIAYAGYNQRADLYSGALLSLRKPFESDTSFGQLQLSAERQKIDREKLAQIAALRGQTTAELLAVTGSEGTGKDFEDAISSGNKEDLIKKAPTGKAGDIWRKSAIALSAINEDAKQRGLTADATSTVEITKREIERKRNIGTSGQLFGLVDGLTGYGQAINNSRYNIGNTRLNRANAIEAKLGIAGQLSSLSGGSLAGGYNDLVQNLTQQSNANKFANTAPQVLAAALGENPARYLRTDGTPYSPQALLNVINNRLPALQGDRFKSERYALLQLRKNILELPENQGKLGTGYDKNLGLRLDGKLRTPTDLTEQVEGDATIPFQDKGTLGAYLSSKKEYKSIYAEQSRMAKAKRDAEEAGFAATTPQQDEAKLKTAKKAEEDAFAARLAEIEKLMKQSVGIKIDGIVKIVNDLMNGANDEHLTEIVTEAVKRALDPASAAPKPKTSPAKPSNDGDFYLDYLPK